MYGNRLNRTCSTDCLNLQLELSGASKLSLAMLELREGDISTRQRFDRVAVGVYEMSMQCNLTSGAQLIPPFHQRSVSLFFVRCSHMRSGWCMAKRNCTKSVRFGVIVGSFDELDSLMYERLNHDVKFSCCCSTC